MATPVPFLSDISRHPHHLACGQIRMISLCLPIYLKCLRHVLNIIHTMKGHNHRLPGRRCTPHTTFPTLIYSSLGSNLCFIEPNTVLVHTSSLVPGQIVNESHNVPVTCTRQGTRQRKGHSFTPIFRVHFLLYFVLFALCHPFPF